MKTNTLTPELLDAMDAYWRAANYLSVGQIYLFDNPLLKRPLTLADVKHIQRHDGLLRRRRVRHQPPVRERGSSAHRPDDGRPFKQITKYL